MAEIVGAVVAVLELASTFVDLAKGLNDFQDATTLFQRCYVLEQGQPNNNNNNTNFHRLIYLAVVKKNFPFAERTVIV